MKRISSGTVTVFVMAIVVGLVAAFVVKQVLAPKPQPVVEKPTTATINIVVAARNLKEDQFIRRGDVKLIQIPAHRKPKNGAMRLTEVAEHRIIKRALKAGQPLNEEMLYAIGETLPGLASRIPAGMRAMPINVDEQSVVAKMVNIGSRVDVALTVAGSHPDLGELQTKTLLHNVEVIAVDRSSASGIRRGITPNKAATITVAVLPADANMIINAEGTGTLDLTLCSPNGEPVSATDDPSHKIDRRTLLGLTPIPPAPKPFIIEKWEGGGVKHIKVSPEHVEEGHRATATSKKFNPSVPVNTDGSGVSAPVTRRHNFVAAVDDSEPAGDVVDEN